MKFVTKVQMRVTNRLYNIDMKKQLESIGYAPRYVDFEKTPYLINTSKHGLSFISSRAKVEGDRFFIDGYNPKLALALLAMSDRELGVPGEYWRCNWSPSNDFTAGEIYMAHNSLDSEYVFISDIGDSCGFALHQPKKDGVPMFRKATVDEIVSHLTPRPKTKPKASGNSRLNPRRRKPTKKQLAKAIEEAYNKVGGASFESVFMAGYEFAEKNRLQN